MKVRYHTTLEDATNSKNIIHSGILRRSVKLRWSKNYYLLTTQRLLCYKQKKSYKPMKLKNEILLRDISKVKYVGKIGKFNFIFVLVCFEKKIFVRAEGAEESHGWIEQIQTCVNELRREMSLKILMSEGTAMLRPDYVFERGGSSKMNIKRVTADSLGMGLRLKRVGDSDMNLKRFTENLGKAGLVGRVKRSSADQKPVEVTSKDFQKINVIGQGSFGTVYLVSMVSTGKHYAMKVLNKKSIASKNQVIHSLTELNILKSLSHPFLMKVHYAFQTARNLIMILDFINGGELFYHLELMDRFNEERARFYAAEILLALEFLHENNIVYRDLKPENVLINNLGHIVLIDFGLSKILEDESTASFCGTAEYMSPEVLTSDDYSQYVDWWSFGIVLFEMLTGDPAFRSDNLNEIGRMILYDDIEFPPYMSEEAVDLIDQLTEKELEVRLIEPKLIKSSQFFESIDWNKLEALELNPPYIPDVRSSKDTEFVDSEYLERSITSSSSTSTADDHLGTDQFSQYAFTKNSTLL